MKAPASRALPAPLLAILLILSSAAGAQADGGVQLRGGPNPEQCPERFRAGKPGEDGGLLRLRHPRRHSRPRAIPRRGLLPEIRVTGEVAVVDGDLVFTLGKAVGTGEDASVSEVCVSVNEVVLKARDLTRRLLGMASSPAPSAFPPRRPARRTSDRWRAPGAGTRAWTR
jgi:hypothetical protein